MSTIDDDTTIRYVQTKNGTVVHIQSLVAPPLHYT